MLKKFKDIVSEVAQPISQGEKNFKDLHVKADNRDLVPGVTDQDFLFKGRSRREDTPTASYEKMGQPDDESVKNYDKTLKREEVEHIDEVSSSMVGKYINKAKSSLKDLQKKGDERKAYYRDDSIRMATRKLDGGNAKVLAKEDVEQVDEGMYGKPEGKTATGTKWSDKKVSVTVHSDGKKHSFTGTHSYVTKKLKDEHGISIYDVKFKKASDMKEDIELDEKTLTPAEMKKREEVVKAIKRENPKMDKSMAYAIATKTAKKVAEELQTLGPDSKIKDNKHHNSSDYKKKNVSFANQRNNAVDAMLKHDCAKHVAHEEWGVGSCIPEAHTIVETAKGEGYVSHYDVMFDHGIEHNVPVEALQILVSESHEHTRRNMKEDIDYDYEGEMAKAELNAICDKARALADMMEDDMQLEAWLQSKITKAKYMIDAVYDYLMYSNRNQAGTGPTPSTVSSSYNQSAAMTDTYGSFLNRMGEEVEQVNELKASTLMSYKAKRQENPSQRGTSSPEKHTNLAQAKVDASKSDEDSRYSLNRYKMAGGKVKVAANEEVELEEGGDIGPVRVTKTKHSWGNIIRVAHGISHQFPLHPHHQEILKNLKDGESTSFRDETNTKVTARREGDTIHLKQPGSNTPTPVDRKHFTEEVVDEAMSSNQKKEFADLAHPKGQITYADKIIGAKLQAAKEKARSKPSKEEDKEEMKEEIDASIISDEEKAKLEEIMKAE